MARQLSRQGQQVSALVMIAPPPDMRLGIAAGEADRDEWCCPHLVSQGGTIPAGAAQWQTPVHDIGEMESGMQRIHVLDSLYLSVCRRYLLRPYRGSLTVFQPMGDVIKYGPPLQWKAAARAVEIVFMPGDHRMEKGEQVQLLAGLLRSYLDRSM
jgi:thioesterase domain-containing protein